MTEDLDAEVMSMIAAATGRAASSLRPDTRLLQDLGLFGDEAEQLLLAVGTRFGIDWSGFEFRRDFESEPHLFSLLGMARVLTSRCKKQPLTVAALIEAPERGRWLE